MEASGAGIHSRSSRAVLGVDLTEVARPGRSLPARRAAAPAWSDPLRCPLTLAPDLAQIRLEIHLDRVTLRGDVALLHLLFGL
jgi:hypothetical protein